MDTGHLEYHGQEQPEVGSNCVWLQWVPHEVPFRGALLQLEGGE